MDPTKQPWWPELMAKKDTLTLRELSKELGVSPGVISAALKQTNTSRVPHGPGEPSPELHESTEDAQASFAEQEVNVSDTSDAPAPSNDGQKNGTTDTPKRPHPPKSRPGSKDYLLAPVFHMLGKVPDREIAKMAGVSMRTVANYRSRHKIPGFRGIYNKPRPRRSKIDPYVHLVGKVPDRVVAEKAGVTPNAVRNYRVKHGIMSNRAQERQLKLDTDQVAPSNAGTAPSAPASQATPAPHAPAPHTPSVPAVAEPQQAVSDAYVARPYGGATYAWRVEFIGGVNGGVVTAPNIHEAARRASKLGEVATIQRLGPLIA